MIRPYVSVVVDSFRAAMASRVLWILLLAITTILLALAPFGYRRVLSTQLTVTDIRHPFGLFRQLHKEFTQRGPSPGQRIWRKLDPELQHALRNVVEGEQSELRNLGGHMFDLLAALNKLLDDPNLYHAASWADITLGEEAQGLMDRGIGSLTKDEVRRLNRLLIEAAYPNLIAASPPTSVQFTYINGDVFDPLPVDEQTFVMYLRWLLSAFMGFFVGTLAVLLAILVTAPIVPHMLESGRIELLLSKPVSRWLLFLAKFLGGCIFILLNAVYLIVGLWLIVGLRLSVWEHRMLLCIPVFMFLFMIYHSVSVLAGLIWRSAIMAVLATILFWALCFLVGAGKSSIERLKIAPATIVRLIPSDDTLFAANQRLQVQSYKSDGSQWETLYEPDAGPVMRRGVFFGPRHQPRMLGPIYRSEQKQLVSAVRQADFRGRTRDGAFLKAAAPDTKWSPVPVAEMPPGAMWLGATSDENVVVVGSGGVHGIPSDEIRVAGRTADDVLFDGLPSFERMFRAPGANAWSPTSVSKDVSSDALVVRTAVGLSILRLDDERMYEETVNRTIDAKDDAMAVGFAKDVVVTAAVGGGLRIYDSRTLEPIKTSGGDLMAEPDSTPRTIHVSPNGRWCAILYHNGSCWLYDSEEMTAHRPQFQGQGDISAAQFTSDTMIVADRANRVTWYALGNGEFVKQFAPDLTLIEKIYRYVAVPIYTIFPRPGELDNTVQYILTDRRALGPDADRQPSDEDRLETDPWRPVTNSLAFTIMMLLLGGLYFQRKEF